MKSLGWALIQYDWCPYKKRKYGHRHVHRENTVWKLRQRYASPSQGTPRIASNPPEDRGGARNRSFLTALRRDQPCWNIDLRLLVSRIRQYISVVYVTDSVVFCYSSPSKLIQAGKHMKIYSVSPIISEIKSKTARNHLWSRLLKIKRVWQGLPWWRSGWESAC